MANSEHLERLKDSVHQWNQWRTQHNIVYVDLEGAQLVETDLSWANLSRANLKGANLSAADLWYANVSEAALSGANLTGARLSSTNLSAANLSRANLSEADLSKANLKGADLTEANLSKANLANADLRRSLLFKATLAEANLSMAVALKATFGEANLISANLSPAFLINADLHAADLTNADLRFADLTFANLADARLENADLRGARVYGVSAWDVHLAGAKQTGLVITADDAAKITVDDLEVAQFVHLLLTNRKIRNVIDSVTSKAVLILGRFSARQKPVLEALHARLRDIYNLVPILFDWEPSANRDLTETVLLLANMCRFVIADITDASSIPQELSVIVPSIPSVPVQPIILASEREYAMFEHWRKFPSVLPEYRYESQQQLLDALDTRLLAPLRQWEEAADKAAARERQFREEIEAQRAEIAKLTQMLAKAPL